MTYMKNSYLYHKGKEKMNHIGAAGKVAHGMARLFLCIFVMAVTLCGCACLPEEEEEARVELIDSQTEPVYELAQVMRSDVILTKKIYCTYAQSEREDLIFETEGRKVKSVYVHPGDEVHKGDLLAALEMDDLEKEIEKLTYQGKRYRLLISQAEELRDFDLAAAKRAYEVGQMSFDAYQKREEEISQECAQNTADHRDALLVNDRRLAAAIDEREGSLLIAGMDGTVSYVKENLRGSSPSHELPSISIIDAENCAFRMEEEAYAAYFTVGEKYEIKTSSGEIYEAEVTGDGYDEEGMFSAVLLETPFGDAEIPMGSRGAIQITIDERRDVLALPSAVIHKANDRSYVYIEQADGFKAMQYVETGLSTDSLTEITSGLAEGDMVIRK